MARRIREEHLRGLPGLRGFPRALILQAQPRTVKDALAMTGIGPSITKQLLRFGVITDPDGAQQRATAPPRWFEEVERRHAARIVGQEERRSAAEAVTRAQAVLERYVETLRELLGDGASELRVRYGVRAETRYVEVGFRQWSKRETAAYLSNLETAVDAASSTYEHEILPEIADG